MIQFQSFLKIGERLQITANYDTESTFDFQNLVKIQFNPPSNRRSGTRREDLLMSEEELQKVWILRKILHEMDDLAAIEFLLGKMKKSKTNEEFFASMKRN